MLNLKKFSMQTQEEEVIHFVSAGFARMVKTKNYGVYYSIQPLLLLGIE
jgi:hypothetical protein